MAKYSAFTLLLLLAPPALQAETMVYVTRGAQGELAFSDVASKQAHVLEYETVPQAPPPSSAEQVELMLTVAESLAAARRNREAQRARNRRAQAAAAPPAPASPAPETYPRYGYVWPRVGHPHRGRGKNRDTKSEPVEPERPRRTFRFRPDL